MEGDEVTDAYMGFAIYILGDLARRARVAGSRNGKPQAATFKGNFSCTTVPLPCKTRGSDQPERLALAHESLIRGGLTSGEACYEIFHILASTRRPSIRFARKLGPDAFYKSFKFTVGETAQRRKKSSVPNPTKKYRDADSIRAIALRYKKETENFGQRFEGRFGAFCYDYSRTPEWLERAEAGYRKRAVEVTANLGPDHVVSITWCAAHARILHEMGRFDEAMSIYDRLIGTLAEMGEPDPPVMPTTASMLADLQNDRAQCAAGTRLKQGLANKYGMTPVQPFAPSLLGPPESQQGA